MLLKSWLLVLKAGWTGSTGQRRAGRQSYSRRRLLETSGRMVERFEDRTLLTPTVTDANISSIGLPNGSSSTYKIGGVVVGQWDNSATGDNNPGVTSVTFDFSQFGGPSAVVASNNGAEIYTAHYVLQPGNIDSTAVNFSVTATDGVGPATTADTSDLPVDNQNPTVTAANISLSAGTGTGGAYRIGDSVTATWDDTATGDDNADVVDANVDFSQFGGGLVAAVNNAGIWTATYIITAGSIDLTNQNVSVTADDDAGNSTTTSDDTNATVDNIAPTVTDGNISVTSTPSNGTTYKPGDTITVQWDNSATGDNNTDTISSVTMDFSAFGGGSAVAAVNSSGLWTASYIVTSGSIQASNLNASVTATDNAGNSTTTADTSNLAVDNQAPSVTSVASTAANGTYSTAAVIPITVTFDENVVVTGNPTLTLKTKGTANETATYVSGSGTQTLTFNYTVVNNDITPDLDYLSTTALALNGGTIQDTAGNDAILTLPTPGATDSLSSNADIAIYTPDPVIDGGSGTTDTYKVVLNGANYDIYVGGVLTYSAPVATTTSLTFNGNGGSDTLTLDYSGGNFYTPVTFNAGSDNTGTLAIVGGTFDTDTYDYTDGHSGDVHLNSIADGKTADIDYTGLSPITNSGTPTDIVFNLPVGTANQASLEDNGNSGDGMSQLRSLNGTFELTTFADPTGSLTINDGDQGDQVTVATLEGGFNPALTLNDGAGDDTATLSGVLTLGSATSTGNLAVTAETINVTSSFISTSGGNATGGSMTFTGTTTLGSTQLNTVGTSTSGNVTFNGNTTLGASVIVTSDVTSGGIAFNGTVGFSGTGLAASLEAITTLGTGTVAFQSDFDIDANTAVIKSTNAATLGGITTLGSASTNGVLIQGGTGTLSVLSGGALEGRGIISAPLDVASGAYVDPGFGVGKITLTGYSGSAPANLAGGSTFLVQINGATPGGGATGYDQLVTTSQTPVTINATTQLAIALGAGFSPSVGSSFDIITGTGTVTGTFANLPNNQIFSVNGQTFQIVYTSNTVTLTRVVAATIDDDLAGSQPPNTTFVAAGPTWNPNTVHDGRGYNQELIFSSAGNGTTTATWTFNNLTPGDDYRVSATWKENPNRATNAPYTVASAGAGATPALSLPVNQQLAPSSFTEDDGGTNTSVKWQDLSTSFTVGASGTLTVQLTNLADGFVIADAIRVQSNTAIPALQPVLGVKINGTPITSGGAAFDLGSEPQGTAMPNTATLQLTNTGAATLNLAPLGALPTGFLVTGMYPTTLAPFQTASVTITLDPSVSGGTYNGALSLASDDASSPFVVNLTGIVTGPGTGLKVDGTTTPNGSTLDFGTELTGTDSPSTKTVTITNTGNANLDLGSISVPAGYVVTGYAPTTLTPGTPTSFTIKLDETVPPGTYTGTLTIGSNDPAANPISFDLTGTVVSRIIDNSSPANADGSYAEAGGSDWHDNTVANVGYLQNLRFAPEGSTSSATWTFNGLNPADTFTVFATWRPFSNRATNAPYTIIGAATTTVFVDQTAAPNDVTDAGGNFETLLVNVLPDAGGHITVTLSTTGIAAGTYVIADAVRLVDPPATPNSVTPNSADFGPTETADLSRVYRVYNPNAALHTFTTNGSEANILVDQFHYDNESQDPGFALLPTHVDGSVPLYRMYNANNGQHYLTPSAGERDSLLAIDPSGHGWSYEGVIGELYSAPHAGATELFMLYNDLNGEHLYTPYASEVTGVLAIPGGHWHQQASLGYAYTIDGLPGSSSAGTQTAAEMAAPSSAALALAQNTPSSAAAATTASVAVAPAASPPPAAAAENAQPSPAASGPESATADSGDQASQDEVFASNLGGLLDTL